MISPVSGGAAAYLQSVQAVQRPQTASSSASQSSGSPDTQDKVELSPEAKAASSGTKSPYAPPSMSVAHTGRAGAAS